MKHVKLFEAFVNESTFVDLVCSYLFTALNESVDNWTIRKSVNLMLKSSDTHPYRGKLKESDAIKAAIELANLCVEFAENGQTEEAMNLDADHWRQVITELKDKYEKLSESFLNERKASAVGKYDAPDYKELMDLLDMAKQYTDDNLFRGKDFILYWADDRIMFDNPNGAAVGYDKRDLRKKDIFSGKKEVIHTFKKANYSPELTKKEVEKRSNGKISVEMAKWQGEVTGVNYKFN